MQVIPMLTFNRTAADVINHSPSPSYFNQMTLPCEYHVPVELSQNATALLGNGQQVEPTRTDLVILNPITISVVPA